MTPKDERAGQEVPQAVRNPRARFVHALAGVLALEAMLFDAWLALMVAAALIAIDAAAPLLSPLGWVFGRLLPGIGAVVPLVAYRASGGVIGAFLCGAGLAFAAGQDWLGWALGTLGAAAALAIAVAGFGAVGRLLPGGSHSSR